ncbi:MAG TPA: DUF6510 family protein [Ktedonobacterales bacterium]|jgi:hypothetical protein
MSEIGDMSDESLRLDGNAAAGLLAEIFPFEMTSAQSECAGCGQTKPLGALMLYGGEMGMVLRCPSCDGVQMRIVRARGRYMIDMRGMSLLQIEMTSQT